MLKKKKHKKINPQQSAAWWQRQSGISTSPHSHFPPLAWYDKYSCLSHHGDHVIIYIWYNWTVQTLCFRSKVVRQTLVLLDFYYNSYLDCGVRSAKSLAQLLRCCLSIISNKSAQWRWRLKTPVGYLPIVLLLTWSMRLIVFARGCKEGGVGTSGPSAH